MSCKNKTRCLPLSSFKECRKKRSLHLCSLMMSIYFSILAWSEILKIATKKKGGQLPRTVINTLHISSCPADTGVGSFLKVCFTGDLENELTVVVEYFICMSLLLNNVVLFWRGTNTNPTRSPERALSCGSALFHFIFHCAQIKPPNKIIWWHLSLCVAWPNGHQIFSSGKGESQLPFTEMMTMSTTKGRAANGFLLDDDDMDQFW